MNKHQGFISTGAIIAFLAILVIGGGVAYVVTRPTQDQSFTKIAIDVEQNQSNDSQKPSFDEKSTCTSTTAPWIKVVSPNGGETYAIGDQLPVVWESCNYAGNAVFIEIYNPTNGGAIPLVDSMDGTPNDGNETIVLSAQHQPTIFSGNYELRVFGAGLLDSSDSTFSLFN